MRRDAQGRFLPASKVSRAARVKRKKPSQAAKPQPKATFAKPINVKPGDYWGATIQTVTVEEWIRIIRKALDQAIDGDNNARKFLADYLLKNGGTAQNGAADQETWKQIVEAAQREHSNPDSR